MKNHRISHSASSLLFVLTISTIQAATFTVTTTNISGPGSLPVVINQANASPGQNIVQFGVTNALTLAFPLATITNNLTINGRTDVKTVISGGGTVPIFEFAASTTNTLSGLQIIKGKSSGGGAAINNAGTLLVNGCVITGHSSLGGSGGAMSNTGTITIVSSTISGNQASNGGAIYNSGFLCVDNTLLNANQARYGGAVFNVGEARIGRSTISGNSAVVGFGGGAFNGNRLAVWASTWVGNRALGADGSPGQGCSAFTDHDGGGGGGGSAGLGGAVFTTTGLLSMTNCTLSGNLCQGGSGGNGGVTTNYGFGIGGQGGGDGGGAGGHGYDDSQHRNGGNGGFAAGGGGGGSVGLAGMGGFGAGNGGLGGLGYEYPLYRDGRGANGGAGYGGAIFAKDGTIELVNCTVTLNETAGGTGGVPEMVRSLLFGADWTESGFAGSGTGGGIYNYSAQAKLLNTIIAGNLVSSNSPDLYGGFISTGFNLIGDNQGATGLSINDFQNIAANLGPLQDNGGPTLTCLPLPGSWAIGYGTSLGAPAADQRGVPHSDGSGCDIGAVEVVTAVPMVTGPFEHNGSGFSLITIFDSTNAYRIQGSTNLTTWGDLTNYASGGSRHFTDPATNFTRRFYRAVAQ